MAQFMIQQCNEVNKKSHETVNCEQSKNQKTKTKMNMCADTHTHTRICDSEASCELR